MLKRFLVSYSISIFVTKGIKCRRKNGLFIEKQNANNHKIISHNIERQMENWKEPKLVTLFDSPNY